MKKANPKTADDLRPEYERSDFGPLARKYAARQYDSGSGNYTEERRPLLPDWDAPTLVQEARKLQKPGKPGT